MIYPDLLISHPFYRCTSHSLEVFHTQVFVSDETLLLFLSYTSPAGTLAVYMIKTFLSVNNSAEFPHKNDQIGHNPDVLIRRLLD